MGAIMDAAVAAVKGVVIVEFSVGKGAGRRLEFTSRDVGLELGVSGAGCCRSGGLAKVVVKKTKKGGQADRLGVQRSWVLEQVNGSEVTGLAQARQLLAEHCAKLPEA